MKSKTTPAVTTTAQTRVHKTHFVCWVHPQAIDGPFKVLKRGSYEDCIAFLRKQWEPLMRSWDAMDGFEIDVRYADGRRSRWLVPGITNGGAGQGSCWLAKAADEVRQDRKGFSDDEAVKLDRLKVRSPKSGNRSYRNLSRRHSPQLPRAEAVDWRTCNEPTPIILNFPEQPTADDILDLKALSESSRSNLLNNFLQQLMPNLRALGRA